MEPQVYAAIGAAVAVGVTGGKLVELLWPNGNGKNGSGEWRSKIELLVEQQLHCMEEHQKQSAESMQMIVLMEHQMSEHEKRESQAWRDLFELLRRLKGEL
jgi:hypothetical protein